MNASKSMLTITGTSTRGIHGPKVELGINLQEPIRPKSQALPKNLLQLVEEMKVHIKEVKQLSIEASCVNYKPLVTLTEDIVWIGKEVQKVERGVGANAVMKEGLFRNCVNVMTHLELTQRTQTNSFLDNKKINNYFIEYAEKLQRQLLVLSSEIQKIEKSLQSGLLPDPVTPEDLSRAMQRLHECFLAQAGIFHSVHSKINNLKEGHLALRRVITYSYKDIFKNNLNKKTDEVNKR